MITIIEKNSESAHRNVQNWRSENSEGYLIVYRSPYNAMLHRSLCLTHLGNTEWEEGRLNWGSLGNATKVCSQARGELTKWAKDHMKVSLKTCKHCSP